MKHRKQNIPITSRVVQDISPFTKRIKPRRWSLFSTWQIWEKMKFEVFSYFLRIYDSGWHRLDDCITWLCRKSFIKMTVQHLDYWISEQLLPNLARTFEFFTPDAIHPSSQHFMCRVVWFLVHESYKTQILDVSNSAGKRRINSAGSMQSSWKAFQRKIPMVYGRAVGAASSTIGQKCLGLKQFERLRPTQLPSSGFCKVKIN